MIELTQLQGSGDETKESPIAINPRKVESVGVWTKLEKTAITFGDCDYIIVKESYGYVLDKIKEALHD